MSIADEIARARDNIVKYTGELSAALDFGSLFGQPRNNLQGAPEPDVDFTTIDRTNPEPNDKILGIRKEYVGYGIAGLGVLVVLAAISRMNK